MAANYRYTDPVFNAMYGARAPFQIPGGLPTAHLPPRVLARHKPVQVWHPPCPDRSKPTRKEVVLRIRTLQEQGKIPDPFPRNSGWDFLPLTGILVGASAPPVPSCSIQQGCEAKPQPALEEDELKAWNRAHTAPRIPQAPGATDLSELFIDSSKVEVTLSPALQTPGARLAGANVWVAWNKLGLDPLLQLGTLMRADDRVVVSTFEESSVHVHPEAKVEVLPLASQYKPAFKRFLQAVNQLYQFVDRLAPGQMNDPDWLKDERYNDALEACRTVLDRLDSSSWTEEERDIFDQLEKNKWKAVREVDAAIQATVELQIPMLQQHLAQSLEHRNQWLYVAPELIEKLAPLRMPTQPMAIVSPAGLRLDKARAGGHIRQLDYLLNGIKPNFEYELSPKLEGRANVDLAGLVIMVVVDDAHDQEARAARQILYRQFFDTKRDQMLLLTDPVEGTHCERSHGIPDERCVYLGRVPVGAEINAAFDQHLQQLILIAAEMRRSGFTQLPGDDELRQMGAMRAADTLKLHLKSAGAAGSSQGKTWLDRLQPDLTHFAGPLLEQYPKQIVEWFDGISKRRKVDAASFVEASSRDAEAMSRTLLQQLPSLILRPRKTPGDD